MRKFQQFVLLSLLFCGILQSSAQVGIGTASPNSSAKLEVNSTTQGFLPPRMNKVQRDAISSPVAGLIIWCNNCGANGELQVYNGTAWTNLVGGTASSASPTVSTTVVSSVTATTATSGGNVTSDGGATITARGVCWSTSANPTTSDSKTTDAGTTGSFTSNITGLTASTNYYLRAYATNSVGTSYGAQETFTTSAPSFACGSNVTFTYNGGSVTYGTVTGANGRCWLDRNLGAIRIATSYNDIQSFGDLFQWGRLADGHQLLTWASGPVFTAVNGSTTISVASNLPSNPNPGYPNYIDVSSTSLNNGNWLNPANDNLWLGTSGVNNPCPNGWRLPTIAEWTDEKNSFTTQNYNGAFASSLKLSAAGGRSQRGAPQQNGSEGYYWSSDVSSTNAKYFYIGYSSTNLTLTKYRAEAASVRCIKD